MARPEEAAANVFVASATTCWFNWRRPEVTGHDGRVRPDHPALKRALALTQSATSLRLMLRDPLAFAWRYGLDGGPRPTRQPLGLDSRTFGELVHDLLKQAVDALEPQPGYLRASRHEVEEALSHAIEATATQWPLERPIPPLLLWHHTLAAAGALGLRALTLDEGFRPGTRSWTEVRFGEEGPAIADAGLPWNPGTPVEIGDLGIRVRGKIDRLDLNSTGDIRVPDYKTGREPKQADRLILGGGAELQRALYALAAHQLLGGNRRIVTRLMFLGEDEPRPFALDDVNAAIAALAGHIQAALALLTRGTILAGPDAREELSEFRLALPAPRLGYFAREQSAFAKAFGDSPWSGGATSDLADAAGRIRALNDLDATLVVEAAAGTGKTSLIAGRLTMMLARGRDPARIADDYVHRACRERIVCAGS